MALTQYINIDYPSKILLFGEYTVLDGSKALAIPYGRLSGRWKRCDKEYELFNDIASYIDKNGTKSFLEVFDSAQFRGDISNGLCFDSDIPCGYGVGSSGSLTAAILDRYTDLSDMNISAKMEGMAMIEGFFHGHSSGLDPLISLLRKPALLDQNRVLFPKLDFNPILKNIHLFNSNIARSTQQYVTIFEELKKDDVFLSKYNVLVELNNKIIDVLLNKGNFNNLFKEISKIQLDIFKKMIPLDVRYLWEKGIEDDSYYMKLCGAGGGGFFLVYKEEGADCDPDLPLLSVS